MTQKCDRASEAIELLGQQQLEISDRNREEIIDRIRPTALIIHETIRIEGESELCRPVSALARSGLAAGLSMDFRWWLKVYSKQTYPSNLGVPSLSALGTVSALSSW